MTKDTFNCGHPRDEANTQWSVGRALCKTCRRKAQAKYRQDLRERESVSDRYHHYRARYLPAQLENTRRKLAALENEARRYGMHDLLEKTQ